MAGRVLRKFAFAPSSNEVLTLGACHYQAKVEEAHSLTLLSLVENTTHFKEHRICFYSFRNPVKLMSFLAWFFCLGNYRRQIFGAFSKATHIRYQCETRNFWTLGKKSTRGNGCPCGKELVRQEQPRCEAEVDPNPLPRGLWDRHTLRIEYSSQIMYEKLEPRESCQW